MGVETEKSAPANYESWTWTFKYHRCGGNSRFYSVQVYFGIAVEVLKIA